MLWGLNGWEGSLNSGARISENHSSMKAKRTLAKMIKINLFGTLEINSKRLATI